MNNQFVQIRFETRDVEKSIRETKHNLRQFKNIPNVVKPDNENFIYYKGKSIRFKHNKNENSETLKQIYKEILEITPQRVELHQKLYKDLKNRTLETDKQKSLNGGVLTFSDSIMEIYEKEPKKVWEYGCKTILKVCKELDITLHYITLHTDETGNIHFHFFVDNFNSKGNSPKVQRDKKVGSMVQDLSEFYFKELGFSRGIPKEISKNKHITTEEYKEYMEQKTMILDLSEKVEKLEIKKTEQEKKIQDLNKKYNKMKEQFLKIQEEYSIEIEKLFNEITEIYEEEDTNTFLKLLERYVKSSKKEKLKKYIKKHSEIVEKLKTKRQNDMRKAEQSVKDINNSLNKEFEDLEEKEDYSLNSQDLS